MILHPSSGNRALCRPAIQCTPRWRCSVLAAATACLFTVMILAGPAQAAARAERLNPDFENYIDDYLADFMGVGKVQNETDSGDAVAAGELSADSFARRISLMRDYLARLERIDRSSLSVDQDIEYRFLQGQLKADLLVAEQVPRWRQDPRIYLNNAPVAYKILGDPRAIDARAEGLIGDLALLQKRLANGAENLNEYIPRWIELTHLTLDGFRSLLQTDLLAFAARVEDAGLRTRLLAENADALAALDRFQGFLREDVPQMPVGDFRVGPEVFNALQEHRFMFPEDDIHLRRIARGDPGFTRVPGFHEWGRQQFAIVQDHLRIKARRIDSARSWLEIIKAEKEDHFFAEQLVYKHHEATRATRDWVIDNDLVSIPWDDDDSIMAAADPSMWASQWWGFGPSVAPDSPSRKSAWRVIPVSPDWPREIQEANLSEKDASFMYAIAPHEVYPGHHLQSLYRKENPRKLRRYLEDYSSNQAWCYYIEWELTPDPQYGWFPEDKQDVYELETLRLKLWRFGRVIIDSGINTGRLSYDEAVELETATIGFVPQGGQINIDNIVARTGADYAAPTLGYFQWMLLREDYFSKMRELDQKGTLKDFHDRVYRIGFLPVVLVREALFHGLEQEFGT
ncbi:DUF885 family protein [Chromatocurvus halotolerans]|uniref:Uncharacterized protein DUF885 n=1 Tax=Chromatocurvus halotolerans TaxID=1132028 RepID=A0A4R2L792_9GAMM|nr:DUF885 family protein [Chromatocurvus halotolerans]TCO78538.1 uncharacterized protein DUF885 [Chromatocurvus halotolerans]